jgi:predicted ester cyclase
VTLQLFRGFANGFPDFRFEIVDLLTDDERGMCRMIFRGTHTGHWAAEAAPGIESLPRHGLEDLPPTGRRVEFQLAYAFAFAGGKITMARLIVDPARMLSGLGVLPEAKPPLPRPVVWVAKLRQRLGLLERHRP